MPAQSQSDCDYRNYVPSGKNKRKNLQNDNNDILLGENVAMIDTQNDSIQSLNFGKIGFKSIFDSILVSQNSIQTIIQFKNNCGDSIQ